MPSGLSFTHNSQLRELSNVLEPSLIFPAVRYLSQLWDPLVGLRFPICKSRKMGCITLEVSQPGPTLFQQPPWFLCMVFKAPEERALLACPT